MSSSTFNTNWAPYGTLGTTYYDYANSNDMSLNNAMNNYILAATNYQKVYTDISYCLSSSLNQSLIGKVDPSGNSFDGVPYRKITFVDGGSLDLSNGIFPNPTPVTGGKTSNYISFSNIGQNTFTNSDIGQNGSVPGSVLCATLYNNAASTSNINSNQVTQNTTQPNDWSTNSPPGVNHGLLDYVYYELQKASNDLSNNYGKNSNINYGKDKSYPLMDIDTTYQNIVNKRNGLDKQVQQLYTLHNNTPIVTIQSYDSAIFAGLLWTILAIVILYYVFMKL
jgi:hypothetical protein